MRLSGSAARRLKDSKVLARKLDVALRCDACTPLDRRKLSTSWHLPSPDSHGFWPALRGEAHPIVVAYASHWCLARRRPYTRPLRDPMAQPRELSRPLASTLVRPPAGFARPAAERYRAARLGTRLGGDKRHECLTDLPGDSQPQEWRHSVSDLRKLALAGSREAEPVRERL